MPVKYFHFLYFICDAIFMSYNSFSNMFSFSFYIWKFWDYIWVADRKWVEGSNQSYTIWAWATVMYSMISTLFILFLLPFTSLPVYMLNCLPIYLPLLFFSFPLKDNSFSLNYFPVFLQRTRIAFIIRKEQDDVILWKRTLFPHKTCYIKGRQLESSFAFQRGRVDD